MGLAAAGPPAPGCYFGAVALTWTDMANYSNFMAPPLPDSSRSPDAPSHPVLTGQPALVTGATLFVDGGMTLYPGFATGG